MRAHADKDKQTFITTCLVFFILSVEWGIAVGLLPIYIHEVGGSAFEVGLVATFFAGISTFTHPLWGAYSDKIGKRKVLIVFGMIGLSAIFLLMSLQKNPLILTLIRGSTAVFVGQLFHLHLL